MTKLANEEMPPFKQIFLNPDILGGGTSEFSSPPPLGFLFRFQTQKGPEQKRGLFSPLSLQTNTLLKYIKSYCLLTCYWMHFFPESCRNQHTKVSTADKEIPITVSCLASNMGYILPSCSPMHKWREGGREERNTALGVSIQTRNIYYLYHFV